MRRFLNTYFVFVLSVQHAGVDLTSHGLLPNAKWILFVKPKKPFKDLSYLIKSLFLLGDME